MMLGPGSHVSHFGIVERIGAGGMGEVYRARDEHLDRDVALKVLPEGLLADERARRRFRGEALALSRLNHPHIATVHDFATCDGTDVLVMEYVAGEPLSDRWFAAVLTSSQLPFLPPCAKGCAKLSDLRPSSSMRRTLSNFL